MLLQESALLSHVTLGPLRQMTPPPKVRDLPGNWASFDLNSAGPSTGGWVLGSEFKGFLRL